MQCLFSCLPPIPTFQLTHGPLSNVPPSQLHVLFWHNLLTPITAVNMCMSMGLPSRVGTAYEGSHHWRKLTLHSQHPSAVHNFLDRGFFMTSSPIHTRMLTRFIFCKSSAKKHSCQECLSVTVLPCPGNTVSRQSPHFCFLQSFYIVPWALGRWAQEKDEHSVWCSGQLWLCQLLTAAGFQLDALQGVRVMIPFFSKFCFHSIWLHWMFNSALLEIS